MSTRHVKLVATASGNLNSELNKMSGGVGGLVKKLGLLIIAQRVVKAGFNATVQSIGMAIDAQEDMNKFLVVMGDNSEWVNGELEDMSENTNRNVNELRAMTASMQDLLVPAGLARDVAADLSVKFVTLATDVSSFNNVPVAEVLEAIRAGVSGSTRGLRRFGVDARVASLEATALTLGITETWDVMSQANKAAVIYNKILADTADAQGDAARTSQDAASLLIMFKSAVDEAKVSLGENFIPLLEKLIPLLVDELGAGFSLVNDAAVSFADIMDEIGPVLIDRLGDLVWVLGELKIVSEMVPEPIKNVTDKLREMVNPLTTIGFLWDNSIGLMRDAEVATDTLADSNRRLGESQRELQITMVDMGKAIESDNIPALIRMREELQNMEFGDHVDQIQGINDALGNMSLQTIASTVATMDNAIAFAERANAMTGNLGIMDGFVARLKDEREEMAELGIAAQIAANTVDVFVDPGGTASSGDGADDPELDRMQRIFEKRVELERLAKEEKMTAEQEYVEQVIADLEEIERRQTNSIRHKRDIELAAQDEVAAAELDKQKAARESLQAWAYSFGEAMMQGKKGAAAWGEEMWQQVKRVLMMKGIELILNMVTGGGSGFFGKVAGFLGFQGGGKPPIGRSILKAQGGFNAIPGVGSTRGDVFPVMVDPTETILTQSQMQERAAQSGGGGGGAQIYIDFNSTLPPSALQKAELVPIVMEALREAGVPI